MIRHAADMLTEVRENMRGGTGAVTIRHYFTREEFAARARLCAKMTVPPGASIGAHRHEGEDEVYVIVKGEGMLDDGRTQTRVTAGDAILTGRGESHAISNAGAGDLEIMAFIMLYGA